MAPSQQVEPDTTPAPAQADRPLISPYPPAPPVVDGAELTVSVYQR